MHASSSVRAATRDNGAPDREWIVRLQLPRTRCWRPSSEHRPDQSLTPLSERELLERGINDRIEGDGRQLTPDHTEQVYGFSTPQRRTRDASATCAFSIDLAVGSSILLRDPGVRSANLVWRPCFLGVSLRQLHPWYCGD